METQFLFMGIAGIIFFLIFIYLVPVNLWMTALFSGVQVELMELVFMRIRKSPVATIINSLITLTKAGVVIDLSTLETHALAGGDLEGLTAALIKVKSLNLPIARIDLIAQDLAGNDLMKYIEERKQGVETGIYEIKQKLCAKIWEDLNDDQVRDVVKYISAY
ncbi:MAG: flotillin-like FloA family protein [Reichenbachiella sp.]